MLYILVVVFNQMLFFLFIEKNWKFLRIFLAKLELSLLDFNDVIIFQWFQWVSQFKAADTRPLGIGKKYHAFFNVPFFGKKYLLLV